MTIIAEYNVPNVRIHRNGVEVGVRIITDVANGNTQLIMRIWEHITTASVYDLARIIVDAGPQWSTSQLQRSDLNRTLMRQSNSAYETKHSTVVANSDVPNTLFLSIEIGRTHS